MINFLSKLKDGLKKTSDKFSDGLKDIISKRPVDSKLLDELEELLISSDLGVQVSSEIVQQFSSKRFNKEVTTDEVKLALSDLISQMLLPLETKFDVTNAHPFVILMVGVNGAGKTTSIGKLASQLKLQGKQVSMIAADTFRAAAVEQLEEWANRSDVRVFKGKLGADSAGLCYDGLNAAIKAGDDVVFIDTAGRLQNKTGLMDELKKIVRVIQKVLPDAPHLTLLTIDATTGQNAVSQVKEFKEIVDVNGLIVTKLDGSSKGGILVQIAGTTPVPVYFIGVGEKIEDLGVFKAAEYAENILGLSKF